MKTIKFKLKPPVLIHEEFSDHSGEWYNVLINGKNIGTVDEEDGKWRAYPCLYLSETSGEIETGSDKTFSEKDDAVIWVTNCFVVFLSQFFL